MPNNSQKAQRLARRMRDGSYLAVLGGQSGRCAHVRTGGHDTIPMAVFHWLFNRGWIEYTARQLSDRFAELDAEDEHEAC